MVPFLNKKNNQNEIGIFGDHISFFNINNTHKPDQNLLTAVEYGNGVTDDVFYTNLINGNGTYTSSTNLSPFPYFNTLNSKESKVVSGIRQRFSGYSKSKTYKYYGSIFDLSGKGVSGFQSTLVTNWYSTPADAISTINKYDFTKNGAIKETFSKIGMLEPSYELQLNDTFIARTLNTYNFEDTSYINPLLPTKVFKLFKTKAENYNGLNNTSTITNITYNANNSPITSATILKNGNAIEKTTTNIFGYDGVLSNPYIVDRLNSKINTVTLANNDVHSSEELYGYDANLLKQLSKRTINSGLTSDFITESNNYDTYGNIIEKKISATGMQDRVTTFEYDNLSHRFLTKKIDTELQQTIYDYDQFLGLLKSETLPSKPGYPLTTSYIYDKWGKVLKVTDYLGNSKSFIYQNIAYTPGIIKTCSNTDGSVTKTVYDPLGRVIHEGYKVPIKNLTLNTNNSWSVKTTEYNIYDQPIKTYKNYYDGNEPEVWDEMQYDIYGRLVQVNHLKSIFSEGKTTTFSYNGLTTTENDGLKTKTTIKDASNQIISLQDNPGESITYEYFANGGLKKTTINGASIEIMQDAFGRKKTMIDPSAGTRNYTYNKFGELTAEEVVGKGITEFDLDAKGKLLEKRIKEQSTLKAKLTYNYNTYKQLSGIVFNDYSNGSFTNYSYDYDDYKRLKFKDESAFQYYFQQATTYDSFGRPEKELYSATNTADMKSVNKWIKYEYVNGVKRRIYDMLNYNTTGAILWEAKGVNENNDVVEAQMNNGLLKLTRTFDDYGFPTQIKYSNNIATNYMTLNTEFESIYGNLTKRNDNIFGIWQENLLYDANDRLTNWKDNEGFQTQSYNNNGTIANNKIGNYAYTNIGKPFQVSTVTPQYPSPVYTYYANREQNITYDVNKNPLSILEQNTENIYFEYNAFNDRSIMYYGGLQPNKLNLPFRKYYSADGSMEIKRNMNNNTVEFYTFVGGNPYTTSIVLKSNGTSSEYLYLLKDYQGTINGIVNQTGGLVEKRRFDVWGKLVGYSNINGQTTIPTTANGLMFDRGYTGHEHLLGVNIINMNGRIYDYNLHKFLQPDNNIQDFYNTQNYNRYAYVLNNPTKYTDESGEFWQFIVATLFKSYAAGYQSSGNLNPLKWNSDAWKNAGLGVASYAASTFATNSYNNYVDNYGKSNINYSSNQSTVSPVSTPWENWTQDFVNSDETILFSEEKRNDYGILNGTAYAYYSKGSKTAGNKWYIGSYNYTFLGASATATGDTDGFNLSAESSYFKQDGNLKFGKKGIHAELGGSFEFLSGSGQLSGSLYNGKTGSSGKIGFDSSAEIGIQVLKAEINGGFNAFGLTVKYSAEVTGLSAHIGHSSTLYYDRKSGTIVFKDAAHLGWIVGGGGGGGIDVSIPIRDWSQLIRGLMSN